MTPDIIELGDRVFEIGFEETGASPVPGWVRGRYYVRLLSGPGLTQEECDRIVSQVLADCVRRGVVVRSWKASE